MHRNHCILMFILSALFAMLISVGATAEEATILDYADSMSDYCHGIASINTDESKMQLRGTKSGGSRLVLCRTDGRETVFPERNLKTVLKGPGNRFILAYGDETAAAEAAESLRNREGILYAETDAEISAAGEEISFHSAGATQMDFSPYLGYIRDYQRGTVTVAVVDSGVSAHPMLAGRTKAGGYDYVDNDTDPTNDLNGHGTHVAGIIADCTSGTNVRIYPIRVLNASANGKISNVTAAVLEAAESSCSIINLSLESYIQSEALEDAIREAIYRGCIIVAAAGNGGENTASVTPGRMTEAGIVVVGSAETNGEEVTRASYSNYGESVDLYAYGSNISSCSRSGGFVTQSGTSMAAAHISGACALMQLIRPDLSASETVARLKAVSADPDIPVPQVGLFAPETMGFSLTGIRMSPGEIYQLPSFVFPGTSFMRISYTAAPDSVVEADSEGRLKAKTPGTATVTASCTEWQTAQFSVTVAEDPGGELRLNGIRMLDEEAFAGTAFSNVTIAEGLETAGNRVFSENPRLHTVRFPAGAINFGSEMFQGSEQAVVLCSRESAAYAYAAENGIQYILDE